MSMKGALANHTTYGGSPPAPTHSWRRLRRGTQANCAADRTCVTVNSPKPCWQPLRLRV